MCAWKIDTSDYFVDDNTWSYYYLFTNLSRQAYITSFAEIANSDFYIKKHYYPVFMPDRYSEYQNTIRTSIFDITLNTFSFGNMSNDHIYLLTNDINECVKILNMNEQYRNTYTDITSLGEFDISFQKYRMKQDSPHYHIIPPQILYEYILFHGDFSFYKREYRNILGLKVPKIFRTEINTNDSAYFVMPWENYKLLWNNEIYGNDIDYKLPFAPNKFCYYSFDKENIGKPPHQRIWWDFYITNINARFEYDNRSYFEIDIINKHDYIRNQYHLIKCYEPIDYNKLDQYRLYKVDGLLVKPSPMYILTKEDDLSKYKWMDLRSVELAAYNDIIFNDEGMRKYIDCHIY